VLADIAHQLAIQSGPVPSSAMTANERGPGLPDWPTCLNAAINAFEERHLAREANLKLYSCDWRDAVRRFKHCYESLVDYERRIGIGQAGRNLFKRPV
jgi:hypothetical protein